ncbi:unnamed protein product (macronuclear) [Paramecium tetraurelia]|uniref:SP-RING-type domain-containing protein n=1 Tax=Paramecium tetraurelia TaxID=5888 RepID=A0E1X6_PARTE|nr:uncharacterized protein GSPATT00022464001 [Paramecium tetraurelia]CAK89293.1 unnamed protein product [Paramecium tetraurelia]|eukprot:XP_001456690.1 hypothetical protein (macronuclear) [Paramecium tetraurelia strain d4-2]
MKNCTLLKQLQLNTHTHILDLIYKTSSKHHLSELQTQQISQYYKQPPSINSFQELYSLSLLRCDCVKYLQIVDEINDQIHAFFQTQTPVIQKILALERKPQPDPEPMQIEDDEEQNNMNNQDDQIQQQQQQQQQQDDPQQLQPSQQTNVPCSQQQQPVYTQQTTQPSQTIEDEICIPNSVKLKYRRINTGPSEKEARCENCVCQGKPANETENLIQCLLCLNYLHFNCIAKSKESFDKCYKDQEFVCPPCVLKYMDHFNKIQSSLVPPSPFQQMGQINHKAFNFTCDQTIINIRCVRQESKINCEEITWPDIGELFLNQKKIQDFKPLINNHSLKKRKDDHILTTEVLPQNCLQIKECIPTPDQRSQYRISLGHLYFLGVYSIEQFNSKQLLDNIFNNSENWMNIEQCQDFISLYLNKHQADDIKVDSLTVQLTCAITFNLMNTPIRGSLCQHIQCFGLENYITAMYSMQPRKWRCPICKKKLFTIQIDAYQYAILNTIKKCDLQVNEITFDNNGQIANENIQKLLNLDNLPNYGIKNNNRMINLEMLSNDTNNIYYKLQIVKTKETVNPSPYQNTLQHVINNMMLSSNQHLRSNSYANFYANNYYINQMKIQQQARMEDQQKLQSNKSKIGQNHDSAIIIE